MGYKKVKLMFFTAVDNCKTAVKKPYITIIQLFYKQETLTFIVVNMENMSVKLFLDSY